MRTRRIVLGMALCLAVAFSHGCASARAKYQGKRADPVSEVLVKDLIGRDFTPSETAEFLGDSYILNAKVFPGDVTGFASEIGANLVVVDSGQVGSQFAMTPTSTYHAPQHATATAITYGSRGPITTTAHAHDYGGTSFGSTPANVPVWRHRIRYYRDPSLPGIKPLETK